MSNLLEYTISLQDLVSTKLRKITVSNDMMLSKWSEVQQKSISVSSAFNKMGTSVHTLNQKIDLLKAERDLLPIGSLSTIRKYNSEIGKLERKVTKLQTLNGSKVKTWFKDALNGLPGIETNPLVLLGAGIGKAIKMGMEADMQKSNILTLVKGNTEKAKALYKDLSSYGIKTPYEKADIIEAQKTMMSFGLESEFAFNKLKNIGDIALGDAQKMKSLSLAFSQATSTGKLQGQDLLQMINAGFNPLNTISEKTGESIASLKERMSKGGVSAKELGQAFEWATGKGGTFYQGAEKASQTLGGKWSNMMDAMSEMMLKIYEIIQPIIMPLIMAITAVFTTIGDGIGWFVQKLQEGGPIINIIASAVLAFTAILISYKITLGIVSFFQNRLTLAVLKTNLAFLTSPLTWVIISIVALIGVIIYLSQKIDGWGKQWDSVVKFMKLSFMTYVEAIKLYFTTLINGIMIGIDKIKLGWYNFKEAVDMGNSTENQSAIAKINADVEARQKTIIDGAKKVLELGKQAKDSLSWELEMNDKSLSDIVGGLKKKMGMGEITPTLTQKNETNNIEKSNPIENTTNGIVNGGRNQTNFNITIQKLQDDTKIYVDNAAKGVEELGDKVTETLLRAINGINQMQTR